MDNDKPTELADIGGEHIAPLIEKALGHASHYKSEFERSEIPEQRIASATNALRWLIQAVSLAAGSELLSAYYGEPGQSRHESLYLLWHRLGVPIELFKHQEGDGPDTFQSLRHELLALMHGDEPALLARLEASGIKGQSPRAFRIAAAKLEILVWDRFVKEQKNVKLTLNEFRSWIAHGFDSSKRNDWKREAEKHLGAQNVELALSFSEWRKAKLPRDYSVIDIQKAVTVDLLKLRDAEAGK